MFFSKLTNGFYDPKIHGDDIPTDSVEITNEKYLELLTAQSRGQIIDSDDAGMPCAVDRPSESKEAYLEVVKNEIRAERKHMLDAVTGIGFRATVNGNTELAKEAVQVSQLLLDITGDQALNSAETLDAMRMAGVSAYRRIASSVSSELASVFKEVTGA